MVGAGLLAWSGGWCEELERNSIWVAGGEGRAEAGVPDSAVRNAQRVQARGPALLLAAIAADEGHMIQAGAILVEPVTCAIGLGVQAEQLPSIKGEHGVVEAAGLLVLVENGLACPAARCTSECFAPDQSRSPRHGRSVETLHSSLLVDGATFRWPPVS